MARRNAVGGRRRVGDASPTFSGAFDDSSAPHTNVPSTNDLRPTTGESEGADAPSKRKAVVLAPPDALAVLAHYQKRHPRKRPDEKATKAIVRALSRGYTGAELCEAVDGNAGDDWARRTGNQGLPYLLRDNATIDKYRAIAATMAQPIVDEHGCLTEHGERITRPVSA